MAIASSTQEALIIQTIVEFVFNTTVEMKVWSDSTSARQLCKKRGPGRVRHLDLRTLFVRGNQNRTVSPNMRPNNFLTEQPVTSPLLNKDKELQKGNTKINQDQQNQKANVKY